MAVTTLTSTIAGIAGATYDPANSIYPGAVKAFYSKQLLKTVAYALVHGMFGQKTTINSGNRSYEWRKWNNIAVAAVPGTTYLLTEGTTPVDSVVITTALLTATPAQFGTFLEATDVVKSTVIDPLLTILNSKLSQHAGESLDLICRAALAAGTNIMYAGPATSVNTVAPSFVINYDEQLEAIRIMKDNKVTPCKNGRWCAIISFATWQTQMKDRDFKDAVTFGKNADALFSGKFGTFLGIDYYESAVALTEAGTLTTVHTTFMFGEEAYGIISWAGMALETIFTGPGGLTDPLHQRWRLAWKASYVVQILNNLFMLLIKHAVN